MAELKNHPYATIFPEMPAAEFAELVADIRAHGLREPIWTYEGKILDGRHRHRGCKEAKVTPTFREFVGTDLEAMEFVISLNLHRRHLKPGQVNAIGADVEELYQEEMKRRQRAGGKRGGEGNGKLQTNSSEASGKKPREPQARDLAAKRVGGSVAEISKEKAIKKADPKLHADVKAGKVTLHQASRQVKRLEKKAALDAKAAVFGAGKNGAPGWEIITGDCVKVLASIDRARPRLIFADPPYNTGVKYGPHYDDRQPHEVYLKWVDSWINACARILADDGSFWALIGDEYAGEYSCLLKRAGLTLRNWIIWYETFGVNCPNKFNRTHRHLFYAVKDPRRLVFNAEAVSRPSDRQVKYGDKRADPAGKVWDDVWGINPPIPRLVDNSPERVLGFPTQLPEALLRPIVGCASDPGDLILDPFSGSGTSGAVAIAMGRRYVGIEASEVFAESARTRLMALSGELAHAS
jgi:site-specific DNA-methyltransferase (adenine-specific)